jgi:1-acyl-sn-glycerol-3-phosphate acyltransferase
MKVKYSFVAKDELKSSKFFSKYTNIINTIYIRRGSLRDMYEDYTHQVKAIQDGRSVVIFPEGTTFESDIIGDFKSGAIKLAYDKKIPIISLAIYGSSGLNNYDDTKDNIDHHRNVYVALDKIYTYDEIKNVDIITLSDRIHDRLQDKYYEVKNKK